MAASTLKVTVALDLCLRAAAGESIRWHATKAMGTGASSMVGQGIAAVGGLGASAPPRTNPLEYGDEAQGRRSGLRQ